MHLLLAWRENEIPTKGQAIEAVQITLKELGLSQCQVVYALHRNTDNLHLHICVNRIDPETAKAVTPAGGWTRRAMEHAARLVEFAQGWQSGDNAWSYVDKEGKIVQKPKSEKISVPQRINDMENLTGEQSAIRRAQEILKDKINGLSGWDGFHSLMSQNGMRYEKKGSGAVIFVGDVPVKASGVERRLSLTNLEKRFGAFHENRDIEIQSKSVAEIYAPKPLDKANTGNPNWNAFIAGKRDFLSGVKGRRQNLKTAQQEERAAMKERQKTERASLRDSFHPSLPRRLLYIRQAELRTKHAFEAAALKALHGEQRKQLNNLGESFSSYEKWLRTHSLDDEAEMWRHRKNKHILIIKSGCVGNADIIPANAGILGFTMTVTKRGAVFSSVDASNQRGKDAVAFIDTGKVIKVCRRDDNSLLAALQLAAQKWGAVKIDGTDEYKRRCAEIAARIGVKITNLELQTVNIAESKETKPVIPSVPEASPCEMPPKEQLEREREERRVRLFAESKKLAREHFKLGNKEMVIVTNAMEDKKYEGELLGLVGDNNLRYAVQAISHDRIILHRIDDTGLAEFEDLKGRRISIATGEYGEVEAVKDMSLLESLNRNRDRGLSR
jgi:hypothetical protein